MASIHYFQRYSQKENVVTNNTLLLLGRLYEEDSEKFQKLLTGLCSQEIEVGPSFYQQQKGKNSIPDGVIHQNSYRLLIETKLGENYGLDQLKNHLQSFGHEQTQILFSLGRSKPSLTFIEQLIHATDAYNAVSAKNITFIALTFHELIEQFRDTLHDFDNELNALIADYAAFCQEEGLLPIERNLMRAVLASKTFNENLRFGVYYDKRGFTPHQYIGLYKDKAIRAVGKITQIVRADISSAEDNIKFLLAESAIVSHAEAVIRIREVVNDAAKTRGWDISKGHYFFLVERFETTLFKKTSKNSLMGTKFFNLKGLQDSSSELPSTKEIADNLKSKTWK